MYMGVRRCWNCRRCVACRGGWSRSARHCRSRCCAVCRGDRHCWNPSVHCCCSNRRAVCRGDHCRCRNAHCSNCSRCAGCTVGCCQIVLHLHCSHCCAVCRGDCYPSVRRHRHCHHCAGYRYGHYCLSVPHSCWNCPDWVCRGGHCVSPRMPQRLLPRLPCGQCGCCCADRAGARPPVHLLLPDWGPGLQRRATALLLGRRAWSIRQV